MSIGHRRTSECEKSRELLSAHIDGRLAPPQEQSLQAHISDCQACAEELRTLRLTVSALGQLPNVGVPRPFLLSAHAPIRRGPSIWYSYFRNATGAVAALLVALLAFGYLAQSSMPFEVRGTATKAIAPTSRLAVQSSAEAPDKAPRTERETGDDGAQPSQDSSRPAPPAASGGPAAAGASASAPSAAAPLAKPAAPAAVQPAAAPLPAETSAPAAHAARPPADATAVPAAAVAGGSQFAAPTQPPQTIEDRHQNDRSQRTSDPVANPTHFPLGELEWGLLTVLATLVVATIVARLRSS